MLASAWMTAANRCSPQKWQEREAKEKQDGSRGMHVMGAHPKGPCTGMVCMYIYIYIYLGLRGLTGPPAFSTLGSMYVPYRCLDALRSTGDTFCKDVMYMHRPYVNAEIVDAYVHACMYTIRRHKCARLWGA